MNWLKGKVVKATAAPATVREYESPETTAREGWTSKKIPEPGNLPMDLINRLRREGKVLKVYLNIFTYP